LPDSAMPNATVDLSCFCGINFFLEEISADLQITRSFGERVWEGYSDAYFDDIIENIRVLPVIVIAHFDSFQNT
jgi:hypothetical protein